MATATAGSQSATFAEPSDSALGSTIFARLQPATYLTRFLRQNIRPDGRRFDEVRAVQVGSSTIGTAHGSAIVRHGGTIVVAGVKGEWLDTSDEEEHDGDDDDAEEDAQRQPTSALSGLGPVQRRRVVVSVDLTPMSSARFKPGPPGEEAQVLASTLMALLDAAPPLRASSLRIESEGGNETLAWCLYVDLVCIAYDGNALDACMLAINAALQHTTLPSVVRDDESGALQCSTDGGVALTLDSRPLSYSYGIVHDAYLLSDPNAFESTMVGAWITLTLDAASVNEAGEHDVVAVRCSGRCSALVSTQEAERASAQGTPAPRLPNFSDTTSDDFVRVADEELLKVCIARAQKQCNDLTHVV